MALREHLDTFESEDYDLSFSVYKLTQRDYEAADSYEVWFNVGGAGFKVPQKWLAELKEMISGAEEYLEELDEG